MTITPPARASARPARPGFEGANIRAWIGFKHFVYLVEGAVLGWLADAGAPASRLYLDQGLATEITDCSVQLPAVLELDDEVTAQVTPAGSDRLDVRLSVPRDGDVVVLRGKVRLALVREHGSTGSAPAELAGLVVDTAEQATSRGPKRPETLKLPKGTATDDENAVRSALTAGRPGGFVWSWRARYFHCHWSDRVQHSAYVRALEEVVDRFLADRGISVGRMLRERDWIPVVSRARVTMTGPAHMEETVHTVFTVQDVLRDTLFDARMECFVRRGDELVPVATASILHGYAIAAGPQAGGMAHLDDEVQRILTGRTS